MTSDIDLLALAFDGLGFGEYAEATRGLDLGEPISEDDSGGAFKASARRQRLRDHVAEQIAERNAADRAAQIELVQQEQARVATGTKPKRECYSERPG